jgi:hypothetical protein
MIKQVQIIYPGSPFQMLKKTLVQRGATANAFHGNYGCCGLKYPLNLEPVETIDLYKGDGHLGRLSLEQKAPNGKAGSLSLILFVLGAVWVQIAWTLWT